MRIKNDVLNEINNETIYNIYQAQFIQKFHLK